MSDYYGTVRRAYDELAPRYDHRTSDRVHRWMRTVTLLTVEGAFEPGDRVIDLGCGTGEEAVWLAKRGVEVLATDISPSMLRLTERRARSEEVDQYITTRRAAIHDLGELLGEFGQENFDGAYASYSLAYEPDLSFLPSKLADLLKPRSSFVCTIRNRVCLFELLYYSSSLRLGRAMRRWRQPESFRVSGSSFPIRSYTAGEFVSIFSSFFRPVRVMGVPVLLPPPSLEASFRQFEGVLDLLMWVESRVMGKYPLNRLGDHVLVKMERVEGTT